MTGAGSGGHGPPDRMDADEMERCPICLGILAGGELAVPDSCCHVFCLRCLLTWAELKSIPSCPVDRRPFSNVYRWAGDLSCVQVPVRKQAIEPESESCFCRRPEQKVCLKIKPGRRVRRQKTEMTADSKAKGLVMKCNEDDPSSLRKKKMRGTECCARWSPYLFVPLISTSTQDITEPVLVTEDIQYDTEIKQCKPQAQDGLWLSPAAPIIANGTPRQSFHPTYRNHRPFTFGVFSSAFTSSSLFWPGHFVFQGVVCAITCPKGGEKRGSRASTSKAPTKNAESLPSRRFGQSNKTHDETSPSDPSTPPQSSASDSDSSTNWSTKPGKASQVPAKGKGKQVTKQKASGKQKATPRKKYSPDVVCNPAVREEEKEGDGDSNIEDEVEEEEEEDEEEEEEEEEEHKGKAEKEMNSPEQQQSDAEGSMSANQDCFNSADEQRGAEPLSSDMERNSDENEQQSIDEERKQDEGDNYMSFPADSASSSPSSCSEGEHNTTEEEHQAQPVSFGENEKKLPPPSDSQNSLLDDLMSPQCDEPTERDDKMEICAGSEVHNEELSMDLSEESCEKSQPGSHHAKESEDIVAVKETKVSVDSHTKSLESKESSLVDGSGRHTKDDCKSKDDINVVPADCSSAMSVHGNDPILDRSKESAASAEAASVSQVSKDEDVKDQRGRERSQERKTDRQRRSRFHSPTSSWSPKRDLRCDQSRHSFSRSRERDGSPPSSYSSRTHSRERYKDQNSERDYSRRDRSRERRRRPSRCRSRSRSWSRSRSRSRTRTYRRGSSAERTASREQGARAGKASGTGGEVQRYHGGTGRFENGLPVETSPDRQSWLDNPDWVTEKTRSEPEGRNRNFGLGGSSRWEDRRNRGESRGRGGLERGRGAGRANFSFHNQQDETNDNRWQPRNNFSGIGNKSGNDAYSRFNDNRGAWRKDSETGDSMLDRSGWSSASSWAVRRTLPADVQDYYSKKERGGSGNWNRSEEEQPAADPPKSEPSPQTVPGNAPVPVLSVIPPHPPQLNAIHHHYSLQGPQGALPVNLQPTTPYAMPPQVSMHLHPAVPLLQVPAVAGQGLPPPPPPPPPMQQGSQTAAAQPDGYTTQMTATTVGYGKPGVLPIPTKAGGGVAMHGQQAVSQALPSSTTQPVQHNKAQADSSKKEKKQQIQEKAINEVKTAIKPYYQKKEITKEEYKEIVRKAVEKVCHSKSGDVNSSKVANLVKAYVDKYKHTRKK